MASSITNSLSEIDEILENVSSEPESNGEEISIDEEEDDQVYYLLIIS